MIYCWKAISDNLITLTDPEKFATEPWIMKIKSIMKVSILKKKSLCDLRRKKAFHLFFRDALKKIFREKWHKRYFHHEIWLNENLYLFTVSVPKVTITLELKWKRVERWISSRKYSSFHGDFYWQKFCAIWFHWMKIFDDKFESLMSQTFNDEKLEAKFVKRLKSST